MTALLYYSISSDLTSDEIIEVDRRVAKDREAVYLFFRELPSNSKRKAKRLFVYGMFIFQLGQPLAPYAYTIMVPLPPAIERLSPIEQDRILSNKNYYPQIATIANQKVDKIRLTDQQIKDLNLIYYKLENGSITIDKAILSLCGGGFYDWATLAFIIYMFSLQQGNSFQNVPLPHMDPIGWISGKSDSRNVGPSGSRPMTYLEMEKPASMPQQEYSGMTKSERRQLPDPIGRDRSINVDGYPRLDLKFNQVEFKTPKHGRDHGLPVGNNGKTPKTEAIALRDSLVAMPNRENVVWYTDGQYQGGTPRGCDCVNLFDPDTNVIAVYEKSSPDFTPTSSFESDVMGITPIDNSQSNNP